jgi:hypothetical protein
MSKFIERLKQVSQPPPPPMGFRASRNNEKRPKLQLVAAVQADVPPDKLAIADAVIVPDAKSGFEGVVWGVRLRPKDRIDSVIKAGADFVVLPAESAVISADKKIGKALEINESIADALLRAVNELAVDAVTLAEDGGGLTWRRLMTFERFAGILNKPVLVQAAADSTAEELQMIWQTGVSGIIVKVAGDTDEGALATLHNRIDGLEFPSRKHREKVQAVLPRVAPPSEEVEEGEDDD